MMITDFGDDGSVAPVVTKVRYRKKNLVKKTQKSTSVGKKNPNKPRKKNGGFDTAARCAPGVTKVRYRKKI